MILSSFALFRKAKSSFSKDKTSSIIRTWYVFSASYSLLLLEFFESELFLSSTEYVLTPPMLVLEYKLSFCKLDVAVVLALVFNGVRVEISVLDNGDSVVQVLLIGVDARIGTLGVLCWRPCDAWPEPEKNGVDISLYAVALLDTDG